jgi:hypothetical protein
LFSSSVLDVAMGVVFAFLAVSLISSAIVESLNSFFKLRAHSLLSGIKDLVNDPALQGLAKALYEHAAVNPRGTPAPVVAPDPAVPGVAPAAEPAWKRLSIGLVWRKMMGPRRGPAYVDPEQFANALLDVTGLSAACAAAPVVAPGPAAVANLKAAVATALDELGHADPQMRQLLDGIVDRSRGDITLIRKELAAWFDSAMDRVGGAFKRWTQLASFVIAFVLAVLLNVDTIHLATQLWEQPVIAANLKLPSDLTTTPKDKVAAATEMAGVLQADLPVGWAANHFMMLPNDPKEPGWHFFLSSDPSTKLFPWERLAGWIVTAIATLFGAPFWFDALQSFVRLKGAGPSPSEKKKDSAASA